MYNPQITVERIKDTAKKQGIGILKLQEVCDLSRNALSQAGKSTEGMKAKNLYAIAEILQCSVDYLLGRSDSPNEEVSIKKNSNHDLNMGINTVEFSPVVFSTDIQNEQQEEINSMLNDLSPRERTELMMMIYNFYDECKKAE